MTGAFDLLRETVTLAAPAAVHGDELIRTLLLRTEQLPAEDGADGPVTAAISATVAEPQRGNIVSTVFNTGEAHASVLLDHVLGYLASPESARTERSWLLVSVRARLTAGDAVLRRVVWCASVRGSPGIRTAVLSLPSRTAGIGPSSVVVRGAGT
jgi:hypothetical protein